MPVAVKYVYKIRPSQHKACETWAVSQKSPERNAYCNSTRLSTTESEYILIRIMLRLLLLTLLLTVMAATLDSEDSVSGDGVYTDDETEEEEPIKETRAEEVKNEFEDDIDDGSNTIIIIAAVSVVALTIVAITAVVIFRRHLQRREQGVYSVPVEQGQKGV
ncbi:hypothetical protein AMELA_G00104970 [Ameiurus melas]|uniref:Uncharacterized protein n=1 Tax=Ameiurus melas TaxID=219545 RepID=A0A7J6AXU7_AMEME|nr:hypothetical protein AMELA_G00104970 [Ameiurus melas]